MLRFDKYIRKNGILLVCLCVIAVILACTFLLRGREGRQTPDPTFGDQQLLSSAPTDPPEIPTEELETPGSTAKPVGADAYAIPEGIGLSCDEVAAFSGQFPEDRKDELVENVASILVTNRSERYLDVAALAYDIDGKTATFLVSGLPAGQSAWVMETSRMQVHADSVFTYRDCSSSFLDGVFAATRNLTLKQSGNMLLATNASSYTLENITVYYNRIHQDGHLFGGVTYNVSFGTLAPGESAESIAGHFDNKWTQIVRIDYEMSRS